MIAILDKKDPLFYQINKNVLSKEKSCQSGVRLSQIPPFLYKRFYLMFNMFI